MVDGQQYRKFHMKTSIPVSDIEEQLMIQLSSHFIITQEDRFIIKNNLYEVFDRVARCFEKNPNKYYTKDGETYFNPYHSAQYTIFLYYLSNTIYKTGTSLLADKIYYLNKIMNACDLFYAIELPQFFMLEHPVGSVMGRATYGEGFMFYQNCTVGGNLRLEYPVIGKCVRMYAGSSIIGKSIIGNNVQVGAGSLIKNQDVPDNSIVFGESPKLIIKKKI